MSFTFSKGARRTRFPAVLAGVFTICILSFDCVAQGAHSAALPRVGTIKDYPATGLMTGCGNLYVYPAVRQPGSSADAYLFLSNGDGGNAWMNLDGRDVRLRQVKVSQPLNRRLQRYDYRLGDLRVSVFIERYKPEGAPVAESDPMFKMKITLRRGRAVRIVRGVGDSDC